jgi:hypothetical protein
MVCYACGCVHPLDIAANQDVWGSPVLCCPASSLSWLCSHQVELYPMAFAFGPVHLRIYLQDEVSRRQRAEADLAQFMAAMEEAG